MQRRGRGLRGRFRVYRHWGRFASVGRVSSRPRRPARDRMTVAAGPGAEARDDLPGQLDARARRAAPPALVDRRWPTPPAPRRTSSRDAAISPITRVERAGRLSATRQHRYDIWGENLFYGSRPIASPRSALLAWLESPEHRAHPLRATVARPGCDRSAREIARRESPACPSGCSRSQAGSIQPFAGQETALGGEPTGRGRTESQARDERRRARRLRASACAPGGEEPPPADGRSLRARRADSCTARARSGASCGRAIVRELLRAGSRAGAGSWLRFARRRRQS